MIVSADGLITASARSDIAGKRWDIADTATPPLFDRTRFSANNIVLCTADSSVWICDPASRTFLEM